MENAKNKYASVSLLFLLTLGFFTGTISNACTRDPYPTIRAEAYFIGEPLGKMVDTGPNTDGCVHGEYLGAGCPARISGQEMRISRVGGSKAGLLAEALKESGNIAVVVPWDDNPGCGRTVWRAPGLPWKTGKKGLFVAELRPETEWVAQRPTFDIHPAFLEPYPGSLFFQKGWMSTRPYKNGDLTVEQYWDLYEALPSSEEIDNNPRKALKDFNHRMKAHPKLVRRYPGNRIAEELRTVCEILQREKQKDSFDKR